MKSTASLLLLYSRGILLTLVLQLKNSFLYSLQHSLESWIHEPKTQQQQEEKDVRQKQEIEKKTPESARDREERREQLNYEVHEA